MWKNVNDKERASETDTCSSTQKPSKTSYVMSDYHLSGVERWERGREGAVFWNRSRYIGFLSIRRGDQKQIYGQYFTLFQQR
jgi:hypothetical protein